MIEVLFEIQEFEDIRSDVHLQISGLLVGWIIIGKY